jgi:hypothetical protein
MDLKAIGIDGVGLGHLAQNGDQWRVLVNAVINFSVP